MTCLDRLKQKIENKELVVGSIVNLKDYSVSEMFGSYGFDFLWIDAEHAPFDKNDIYMHIMTASSGNTASFIRIPWNDPVIVKPILEMGPDGIIFPGIRTVEEAELAIKSCMYPPKGIRGFGPRRCTGYGAIPQDEYIKNGHKLLWKILQVEHVDCVNNLEEIVQIEGVDALLLGPNDLSASIGLLGQSDHPEVMKLIEMTGKIARKYNKPLGVFTGDDPANIQKWMDLGVNWVTIGGDTGYLSAARKSLQKVRKAFESK